MKILWKFDRAFQRRTWSCYLSSKPWWSIHDTLMWLGENKILQEKYILLKISGKLSVMLI